MKVLRKPDYSWWTHKFTCVECTAELEASGTDVQPRHHEAISSPKPGDSEPAYWSFHVTCPICTTEKQVPVDQMPKALQFDLKDRYAKERPKPVRTYAGDR